jgi:hypothetical protein
MMDRFATRPDPVGWTVYDVFTGEPLVIAMDPQTGLSKDDAEHTAALLSRRAQSGDRTMRQ